MRAGVRQLIAGNWKMNHGGTSGLELAEKCVAIARRAPAVDIVIAPPFTVLAAVAHECSAELGEPGPGANAVAIAGQNLHPGDSGAFTGEISGQMLRDAGCTWVIVGHSERRQLFGETDAQVAEKTRAALKAELAPIVCVGETLAERESGKTHEVVKRQVDAVLPALLSHGKTAVAIAYEPVWAIGTGKNAGPDEAEEIHAAIRDWLAVKSPELAAQIRILYGGSVKPSNAAELLAAPNVDGALIGGASLDAASFGEIARISAELASPRTTRPS